MNRQKSNRTLLIEQERAARMEERKRKREEKERDKVIRKERRERKQAEREARRKERERRRTTHEHIVQNNGIQKIRSSGTQLGIHDAIAYSPLVICAGCVEAVREILDADGLCEKCKYEKEVLQGEHVSERLEALQSKAVPDQRDGGSGTTALAGPLQMTLPI